MRPTPPPAYNARRGGEVTGGLRCLFVDLFEYQARDLLASHGVPVLPGGVAETPEQAEAIAREIAAPVVVKAQVKVGGRGKAGGVKLADNPEDAKARAQDILGLDIKGHITHKVMVAQASDIAEEYYFSYLLDRSNRTFLAMASKEGGMEIEQLAVERPEALARIPIDASEGVDEAKARRDRRRGQLPGRGRATRSIAIAVAAVGDLHRRRTPRLVEVNPLAKAPDGTVLALDAQGHPRRERRLPAARSTRRSRTTPPPTRSRPRPRRRTSTTSSSTARSASSATVPAWS